MENYLENVAVIGAAGKMGSGIALILLQAMVMLAEKKNKNFHLKLIDTNENLFPALKDYLRVQMTKYAEKNMIVIRNLYENTQALVSNREMIEHFVMRSMDSITLSTALTEVSHAKLVFEAIVEDVLIKTSVLKKAANLCSKETFFLSNTSSIPISILDLESKLDHRIIGFHFYNPPAVQKLIEIIAPQNVNLQLEELATLLAKNFHKTIVYSADVAGFIGNGHFIPEALYACKKAREHAHVPLHEAIYLVNQITQNYLIRPMGIFQLIDYVGIDVVQKIAATMQHFLSDNTLQDSLIDQMIAKKILGGQNSDGSQKSGFFKYEKTNPVAYYDFVLEKYIPFKNATWVTKANQKLFLDLHRDYHWKSLVDDQDRLGKIKNYFKELRKISSPYVNFGFDYLEKSCKISKGLVDHKVAHSLADVGTVLKAGFFHIYGPEDL